jgi:hypothetical protein
MQLMNNNPISSQTNKLMTILNNVIEDNDIMTSSQSTTATTTTTSPSCSIQEIENIFTLCQFDTSLFYANEILSSSLSKIKNNHHYKNNKDVEQQGEKGLILSCYDIPMCFSSNLLVTNDDTIRILKLGILRTPHHDGGDNNDMNNEDIHYDGLSIQDRAAFIAIQSSYELWKRRNNKKSIDSTLQQHIQPFLQFYTTTDTTTTSTTASMNNNSHYHHHRVNTISLDLLFVWLQFIYTIGLHSTCIEMILQIIDVVFLSMHDINDDNDVEEDGDRSYDESLLNTTQDSIIQTLEHKFDNVQEEGNHHQQRQQSTATTSKNIEHDNTIDNCNDMIYNQCYNIFHFLLVDILPYIHNKDVLDCITNELCILMTKRIFCHYNHDAQSDKNSYKPHLKGIRKKNNYNLIGMSKSTKECDDDIQKIIFNSEPSLSSITKVYQTIESILNYTKDEVLSLESMMSSTMNTTTSTTSSVTTMKLIPNFVKECLEECLEDVYILLQEEELQNRYKFTTEDNTTNSNTRCNDSDLNENKKLNSIIDNVSNRIHLANNDDDQEEEYNNTIEEHASSSLSMIQDYVIKPLWTSEERWMNRGKVLAVGYLSYTIFQKRERRREQVMNVTKKVGNVLMSPIKEIISAIQN